jgi:hypothetical protein
MLTNVYKLDKDRLYVTYFEGDPKNGLDPDLEARNHWLDVGVAESHVIPGSAKDNFWGTDCPTLYLDLFSTKVQKWALPVLAALQGTDLSPECSLSVLTPCRSVRFTMTI